MCYISDPGDDDGMHTLEACRVRRRSGRRPVARAAAGAIWFPPVTAPKAYVMRECPRLVSRRRACMRACSVGGRWLCRRTRMSGWCAFTAPRLV